AVTPSTAGPGQSARSGPASLSIAIRTRVAGHSASSQRRIVSFSRTWSCDNPKSMAILLAGVARQPEATLRDDVALDVGGSAGDQHAERPHVRHAEHAHGWRVRLARRQEAAVTHDVHRELR